MQNYREKIQNIKEFLERSEKEQKTPFAYEIYLLTGAEETGIYSRTSGANKFMQDIERAVETAKQSNGMLRVDIFRGKSHNAGHINTYKLNVSGVLENPNERISEAKIIEIIENKINDMPKQPNILNELNDFLLGTVGDNEKSAMGVNALFNILGSVNGAKNELEQVQFQKKLDDFKFETRFDNLQETYHKLKDEHTELKVKHEQSIEENKHLKEEKADLENRLAGYAPNELMKRVAIGVISGIGGRILSNSPKTAELLGLTPNELKGALGIVEENTSDQTTPVPETNVEITEISNSPEDEKKAAIIKSISKALITWELNEVAKIANIVGICLDHAELINKTLQFLNQMMQGNHAQPVQEPEISEQENE